MINNLIFDQLVAADSINKVADFETAIFQNM